MTNGQSIIFNYEKKIIKNYFKIKRIIRKFNINVIKRSWKWFQKFKNNRKRKFKEEDLEMSSINSELSKLKYCNKYISELSEDDTNETIIVVL